MKTVTTICIGVCVTVTWVVLAAPDAPSFQRVMAECDRYVVQYESELSTVVAEERYTQRLFENGSLANTQSTTLLSDFVFARVSDALP
jgi:hypothetical protein